MLRRDEVSLLDALRCGAAPRSVELTDAARDGSSAVDVTLEDGDVEERTTSLSN